MRFKATDHNLTIDMDSDDPTELLRGVAGALVPRYARKIYFHSDQPIRTAINGVTVAVDGQEPTNFLRSFRVIHRGNTITVVSSNDRRFSQDLWRLLAEELLATMG
ncbi:hypothetical protein [Lysobacter auxotrophicus]|uniref:Uncharacterized protein n=1 Tax=Lysobacter auxotrophicus TaxID=2992573 RepID=A0ABM8DD40_9GAMM|nr:hypothetical protein [Lysobacter auxotrophicus]BDU16518.1 hypothetical protein LA521A_17190 [Lysobacter auxotrophicus]